MKKTPRTHRERELRRRYDALISCIDVLRKNDPPISMAEADRWLSDLVQFLGIDKAFDRKVAGALVNAYHTFGRFPPMTENAIVVFFSVMAMGKKRYDDVIKIRVPKLPNNRMPNEEREAIVAAVDAAPGDTKYEKFCHVAEQRNKTPETIKKMYYRAKKGTP